jgi:hypothetical protein
MSLFYKNWNMLDGNSSVATDELSHAINFGDMKQSQFNSSVATDELQIATNQTYIVHSIDIPNARAFPIEDFVKVPFTLQDV